MKTLSRGLALLLIAALLLASAPAVLAAEPEAADVLYTLGLLKGSEEGFEADRAPTRAELLTMMVRLAGGEGKQPSVGCPFYDVPDWAYFTAAWAWEHGLIRGMGDARYGFEREARAKDCATLLLRVLGYSDRTGDFSWDGSVDFALRMGILHTRPGEPFLRADLFRMTLEALSASGKEGGTLLERLIAAGEVDPAVVRALGLASGRALSGEELYEKCLPAVFRIDCYVNDTYRLLNQSDAQASGFFVRSDGIAVSNYHPFQNSTVAVVTLSNGERYRITEMLSFSKATDLVVFRVSRESLLGEEVSAFPCLETAGSETIRNGQTVYTLGTPLGQQGSIAVGIVGYKSRVVEGFETPLIQNTAPISQGSSGGVLLNVYGQAIGTTCAYFAQGQNMNLAIPLDILSTLDYEAPGVSIREMRAIEEPELEEYWAQQEQGETGGTP